MEKIEFNVETQEKGKVVKKGGITSARAAIVADLVHFMGEDIPLTRYESDETTKKRVQRRMGYWLGRTKHIDPHILHELMRRTRGAQNPRALMNWLIAKEPKKQKKENAV